MKNVICENCKGEFPLNETLKVRDSILCQECTKSIIAEEKITTEQLQRQIDPTICIGCGLDNKDADLPLLGQAPVCPKCEDFFKNRPFPGWLKASLIGMIILVVGMVVYNSRFIYAYYDLKRFESAMISGDIEQGASYFNSASKLIPENEELKIYAAFYEGINLLNQDKSAEALELFQTCSGRIGEESKSELDDLITNAQIGVAFDQSDYDEFLRLSIQMNEKYINDAAYKALLASAYACKYADTENEQYKTQSLAALESAKKLVNTQPEYQEYYAEYEQRILHRLYTREIIDNSEFMKRYPNGWTPEEQEILK